MRVQAPKPRKADEGLDVGGFVLSSAAGVAHGFLGYLKEDEALNMEKFLTAFMLLMIVVIGAVNIISTLVMFVSGKSADIAILRTMGASQASIMIIFMVQGLVAGILGTVIGVVLGLGLAGSITDVSLALEQFVNSNIEGANLYLLSHLQTEVVSSEVMLVCLAALVTCFLATLYPAYRASCIQPAEVLRYE